MESMTNMIMGSALGLLFVAVGGLFLWHYKRLQKLCTGQTTGVVADEGLSTQYKNGKKRTSYRPTFAYSVEGVNYTKQSNSTSGTQKFSDGQSITVFYDPSKPQRYYILEQGGPGALLTWLPIILGAICALLAIFANILK